VAYLYRGGSQPVGANSTTATFTIPATTVVGDLIIGWWVTTASVAAGPTPPTGWTYGGTTDSGGTANFAIWLYYKVAVSGDAGTVVTFTSGTTRQLAGCGVYYDNSGAGSLSVEGVTFTQTMTTGTRTTVAANCFGVAIVGSRRATGIDTWTSPSGWTERLDTGTDASTGGKSATLSDKLTAVTAGTNLGGAVWIASAGDGTEHSILLAIKPAAAAAFSGSLALSGSGTLTEPTQKPGPVQTLAPSGSGTLALGGTPAIPATLPLSGSGTLAPTGAPGIPASLPLSGSGTLAGTGVAAATGSGTLALSGSGTLTEPTQKPGPVQALAPSGSGTLALSSTPAIPGAVSLSGPGTQTRAGAPALPAPLALSGSGTQSRAGTPALPAPLPLSGAGTLALSGTAIATATGSLGLSGPGTQSRAGTPALPAPLPLSGAGTLALSGTPATAGTGTLVLTGSGTLARAGTPALPAPLPLSGAGTLARAGAPALPAALPLSGAGTLALVGAATATGAGSLVLTGSGTLARAGAPGVLTTVPLSGSGELTLAGAAAATATGTLALTGVGSLAFTAPHLPTLNDAKDIRLGTVPVRAVYVGAGKVWPP
jgi:fibronectin-binding autotransporter adhesin